MLFLTKLFSSKKKFSKVRLDDAIIARDKAENLLKTAIDNITDPKSYEESNDFINRLHKQLKNLKTAISIANLKFTSIGSNQEVIFDLTFTKKLKDVFQKMGDSPKSKKKQEVYLTRFKSNISSYEDRLTLFNQRTWIKVEIDKELGLI